MARGIRLEFEDQRSIAFGGVGANYAIIGTVFANPLRILIVDNLTDADLQFSLGGVNDHFMVAALSSKVIDISSNSVNSSEFYIAKNQGLYVKRIGTPTTGNVYLSAIYAAGD